MSKKKLIFQEKGSITVYAIVTIFTMIFILGGIFFVSSVVRKNQLRTLVKIKEIYASQIEEANETVKSINQTNNDL